MVTAMTNHDVCRFHSLYLAKIEKHLDVFDYFPIACSVSACIRTVIGLAQIIFALGWWLKGEFFRIDIGAQKTETIPYAENIKAVAIPIFYHGLANLGRGVFVALSFATISNWSCLAFDILLPKIGVYNVQNQPRLVNELPLLQRFGNETLENIDDYLTSQKQTKSSHWTAPLREHFLLPTPTLFTETASMIHTASTSLPIKYQKPFERALQRAISNAQEAIVATRKAF